jgi:hypothetical protein
MKFLAANEEFSMSWSPVRRTSFFFLLLAGAEDAEVYDSEILLTLILL